MGKSQATTLKPPAAGATGLTDAQLRLNPVPVSLASVLSADLMANPTIPQMMTFGMIWNGTTWDRQRGVSGALNAITVNDHDTAAIAGSLALAAIGKTPSPTAPAVVTSGNVTRPWYDRTGTALVRNRQLQGSFVAIYRKAEAAGNLDLSFTQVADTTKQWATLWHAATATMQVQITRVRVTITASTVAVAGFILEVRRITAAPATGNPAITPTQMRTNATATECSALTLPTTAGTDVTPNSPLASVPFGLGITGSSSTTNPPAMPTFIDLYDALKGGPNESPIILRPSILEGVAVILRATAGATVNMQVQINYTEEIV